MFSFITKAGVIRNFCKSTTLTKSYTMSCNKQNDLLKRDQKCSNRTMLQVKSYHSSTASDKDELKKFMAAFPKIVEEFNQNTLDFPDVAKWFSEVLQYNVPHGKNFRPLIFMLTYRMMTKPEDDTPENLRLAMILGWCIQIFTANVLISDDIMDKSQTRRGAPCWYKRDEVGMVAVNDCFLLVGGVYALIRKYFYDKPYYSNIQDLFQEISLKVAIGQSLEFCTTSFNRPKLELFTKERYKGIAEYKAAFIHIILPIELALHVSGNAFETLLDNPILHDIGYLCQVENDFLDCFGDSTETGKIGSDIQEGKCTWLALTTLEKASPEQRKIMEECYGSADPQKVAAIRDLYKELGLPREYVVFKEEFMSRIKSRIERESSQDMRNLLLTILEKLRQHIA